MSVYIWSVEGKKLKEPRTAVPEPAGSSEGKPGALLPADPASTEQSQCPLAATQPCWGGLGSWRDRRWLSFLVAVLAVPAQPGHTDGQQPLAPLLTTVPLPPKEICQNCVLLFCWCIFCLIILKCLSHVCTIWCCEVIFQWETCWVFLQLFLVLFFKVSLQYFPFSGCLLYKLLQKKCFPMWLVTIILPNTVIWTKPSFAVRDYLPWGQWNNMYSSQHTSLGMICILDRNISLSPCSRIASRKVLLVLNYLLCCDKITRLCGSWVYGRLANPHLQPAWILLLTYTINSEETSQTLCSPGGWGYAAACMTDGKAA